MNNFSDFRLSRRAVLAGTAGLAGATLLPRMAFAADQPRLHAVLDHGGAHHPALGGAQRRVGADPLQAGLPRPRLQAGRERRQRQRVDHVDVGVGFVEPDAQCGVGVFPAGERHLPDDRHGAYDHIPGCACRRL